MSELAVLGGRPVRQSPFPSWPQFDEREVEAVVQVTRSGKWYRYSGDEVRQFEQAFADYHTAKYAQAVTSGTMALEAGLFALGVGPGDEVLVPSYTFVSTATAVVNNGAVPVFVDIDLKTLNLDLAAAETLVGPNTKAIVPVHFAGCPCDMEAVTAFAKRHGLKVLEDAAHSHGGFWDNRGLGSLGDCGAFSFQFSKNLTCADGGIVLTSDQALATRLFSRHSYGQRPGQPWYNHEVVSTNLRMTEWQGAILRAQLTRLAEQTARRLENARLLDAAVDGLDDLTRIGNDDPRAARRAYHLYCFRYTPKAPGLDAGRIAAALQAEGIPCGTGYPVPLYKQPLFNNVRPPKRLAEHYADLAQPQVEQACRETLWLPQNALLGEAQDTRDIIRAFEKVLAGQDELRRQGVRPSAPKAGPQRSQAAS
ncbi:MAG TPA: DegT/DnrJ/EryC1/StrS family aminotransferase [Limnochordia bacterium]|nr:DegT/DnrJ/EryC1/StrS family aminotransferase [Limnochordia bacterium]